MTQERNDLKRFERRVRLVRSWRGLAIGLCFGAAVSTVWATLDWLGVAYAEWAWFGITLAVSGLAGLLAGFLRRVPAAALSDSIDRRGGLENRLTTSMEVEGQGEFETALRDDAARKLHDLQPRQLYPFRVGRWQASALLLSVLASTIFLLGNSPILLGTEARRDREELKKLGQTVERVAKPVVDPKEPIELNAGEKRLSDELRKLQRDLEKARITKEEAMQRANELAKTAEELTKERAKNTEEGLAKAESAFEKLQKAQLEKNGIKMDPEMAKRMSKMTPTERQAALQQMQEKQQRLQQKQAELQGKLDEVNKDLQNPNLTPEQRKALEEMQKQIQKMLQELAKELKELQEAMDAIRNSEKIQELLQKIQEHPAMKEIQELMAKLEKDAQQGKNGQMPKLTKEDIEKMKERLKELKEELEELADQLQDPEAMEEFMEALKESLKNGGGMCQNAGLSLGLGGLLGLGGPSPGPENDVMLNDTKTINKNKNGKEGQGKTTLTQIKGEQQETGEEAYIEIKGPTTVGTRTSVKYTKVLPSYKKKAEQAIDKKSIPKQHEKRVKEYFDSLTRGK